MRCELVRPKHYSFKNVICRKKRYVNNISRVVRARGCLPSLAKAHKTTKKFENFGSSNSDAFIHIHFHSRTRRSGIVTVSPTKPNTNQIKIPETFVRFPRPFQIQTSLWLHVSHINQHQCLSEPHLCHSCPFPLRSTLQRDPHVCCQPSTTTKCLNLRCTLNLLRQ